MAGSARTIPPPPVNPETKPFWDAAAQGRLLIKRCTACDEPHWYPRAICPFCGSERTEWMEVSGRGTIYSYEIVAHAIQPGFKEMTPYAVVLVELDEQRGQPTPDEALRVIANLVKPDFTAEAEANVQIGRRVRVGAAMRLLRRRVAI